MKRKGFTLIEILATLAVSSVMFVAIASVFYSVYVNWKKQKDLNQNTQAARWAMELLGNELRHGNITCFSSSADQVYFSRGSTCSGGGNWQGVCYLFDGSANILYRCERQHGSNCAESCDTSNPATSKVKLATSVAGASFAVSEGDMADISLTVRPKPAEPEGEGNRNITFETKVRVRN